MSLGGRLANVFVAPGEVFDEVKTSPPTLTNWVVPLVIMAITGIIYTLVVFSQPTIIQGMKAPMEKKFQEMVDSGKMTRQAADQQLEMVEKFMSPQFFKVVGILSSVFLLPAILFFTALIIWLIGIYAFGGSFPYMKAVEGVGLAGVVTVPGTLVGMLLAVIYGNLGMTAGPILLVGHFDAGHRMDRVLSALDLGSLWWVAVLAVALSRLSGGSFLKSALWGFGLWLLFKVGPALIFGGNQ